MMYPRVFSHVGISVPDLEKAVDFYHNVLGFYVIMGPSEIKEEKDTAVGVMCADCFGEGFGSFRIAHLATADGIGIELFEFKNNEKPENNCKFWETGTFHFGIQDPDVEGLVQRIVEAGGHQRMPIRSYYPDEKPYRMCYVEDPFGVLFEIYSHSYETTYSRGEY